MSETVERAAYDGAPTVNPPAEGASRRPRRRRLLVAGLLLFVAACTVAIIYSVTAGGRSPERLDDANARVVESECLDAQHTLAALPQVGVHAAPADRAARVARENDVFTTMIDRLRDVRPVQATPATALRGWLDDWTRLVAARQHYANDLRREGNAARFVEPAASGIDPVADKMNNWILEQGTRTQACNTGRLQAEVVEGTRIYGAASNS